MGYDPNEPRDAEGKWTDAGDAIRAAASDSQKTGVSKDVLNTVDESMNEIKNIAPELSKGVKFSFGDVKGREYAQYDWGTKTISMKKNYRNIDERLRADNISWDKQYGGDYMTATNLKGIIAHEIGHHMDNISGRAMFKEIESLPLVLKNKAYGISGYASVDRFYMGDRRGSEMPAEITAAYLTKSHHFNELPEEIKSIVRKHIK